MDLIDRESLADELAVIIERHAELTKSGVAYEIEDAVEEAKSIDPFETAYGYVFVPVKQGSWINEQNSDEIIPVDKDGWVNTSVRCGVCGDWLTASDEYACRARFCPNCGAKMGENDENRKYI